jgi:hypothetical protein
MSTPEFNPADPFAMMRHLWQAATPASAQPFMPPMSEEDIERKLAELHVVEAWLAMSQGMLSMQIKALEMQKAALAAMKPGPKSATE